MASCRLYLDQARDPNRPLAIRLPTLGRFVFRTTSVSRGERLKSPVVAPHCSTNYLASRARQSDGFDCYAVWPMFKPQKHFLFQDYSEYILFED